MSDQDKTPKPSLKDHLKPHIPALAIGLSAGALATLAFQRGFPVTHITKIQLEPSGDVWFSDGMLKQLKEKGEGMIQIAETGQLIDLIDWAHPSTEKK